MQAQSWRSDPDTQLVYVLSKNAFYIISNYMNIQHCGATLSNTLTECSSCDFVFILCQFSKGGIRKLLEMILISLSIS